MPEPRVAHALVCDQIRQEAGGKLSYVGVRSGDIVVDLDRRKTQLDFAVVAWLICDADDPPSRMTLSVHGPGPRLLTAHEVRPDLPRRRPDSTKAFYQLMLERISMQLHLEGDLEVSLETETGILRAARLPVRFAASALQSANSTQLR